MNTYLALSVVEPAGDRIRSGQKRLEIRKWKPEKLPLHNLVIVQNKQRLSHTGLSKDPDGKIVAIVDVVAVRDWLKEDLDLSCSSYWEEGWYAWVIQNVRPMDFNGAVPARLRIYEIDLSNATDPVADPEARSNPVHVTVQYREVTPIGNTPG